jgi:hypothetical protein
MTSSENPWPGLGRSPLTVVFAPVGPDRPTAPITSAAPPTHPTSRSTSTISTTSANAPTSCCCCAPTRAPAAADTPVCPPNTADTAEFWSSSMTPPPSPHCPPAARRPPPTSTPHWSTNSATKCADTSAGRPWRYRGTRVDLGRRINRCGSGTGGRTSTLFIATALAA